jgi:hypothetical protein
LVRLIRRGALRSLSDFLETRRRRLIGQAIVDGYRRVPADDEFDAVAAASKRSMIAEEPW